MPYAAMYELYAQHMAERGLAHRQSSSSRLRAFLVAIDGVEETRSASTRGYRVASWERAARSVGMGA